MLFLVYSGFSSSSITHSLGTADYSYYFVMERFLPLLREFGEVEILDKAPTDEDVIRHQKSAPCVYLSFAPPNRTAPISRCPVVPVFAWEYSTIPDEEFSCPQDNWVRMLQLSGSAITHSLYARDVVKTQLGEDYPIESIPAPIWDSYQHIRRARRNPAPEGIAGLDLDCTVIDSRDYLISNTSIRPRQDAKGKSRQLLSEQWDGDPRVYNFADGADGITLIGFNDVEPWGVWSKSGYPWVLFDRAIHGEIEISVGVRGYLQNIGKRLRLEIGSSSADLLLSENMQTHVFRTNIEQPTNVLAFVGLAERAVGASDPRDIGMGLAEIAIRRPEPGWVEPDSLVIDLSRDDLVSEGLHGREDPGRWTSSSRVSIQLPTPIAGDFHLSIEVFHMQHNHQRQVNVCLGERRQTITLENGRDRYEAGFTGVPLTDYVCISGLGFGPSGNENDPRELGLGIASISLQRIAADSVEKAPTLKDRLLGTLNALPKLPGMDSLHRKSRTRANVLYTSIFNPKDGRKNWEDIITGFVYAFREDAGATLLVKITYHDLGELYEDIFTCLIELHPFQCRLVFIHGYLPVKQYEQMLLHSHFVVNASRGEGQCLPLMEFMSCGVPAVAPDNTAMAEYINESNAFIVKSSPDITFWAHDPRQVLRTMWRRIDWESLVKAFTDSARVYRNSPRRYRKMSRAAVQAQEKYCSMAGARSRIQSVFDRLKQNVGQ